MRADIARRAARSPDLAALERIRDSYTQDTRDLVAYLRAKGMAFTLAGAQAYYAELLGRYRAGELKAASVNKRLFGLKKRIRLIERGDLSDSEHLAAERVLAAFKAVKAPGLQVDAATLPSAEELARLESESTDPLVRLLVPFLAATGCRISEALAIRLSDMEKANGLYRITVRGKGGKERRIMAPAELVTRIRGALKGSTFLFEHGGRQYTRVATGNRIRTVSRIVLGRDLHAHLLRHYFATRALKLGKSLKAVSLFLGHSSTRITADVYQHDTLAPEDLEEIWKGGEDSVSPRMHG